MSEETKKTEAAKAPEVQELAVEATTESTETVEVTETTPVAKEETQEDFLKNFKLKSGLTLTNTNKKNLPESTLGSVLFNALNMAPTIPVRDGNGEFSLADGLGGEVINPLAQMANTYNKNKIMKLNGFAGLAYNFLDHFTTEANIQFNYAEVDSFSFDPIDF